MSGMTVQAYKEINVLLVDTLSITQDLLASIIHQINSIEAYLPEKEYFWNIKLTDLTVDIGQFVEITTLLSKLVMSHMKVNIPEIKQSHIHLLFVLKGINQAQHKMDSIVLEDLIKYELKDNLTQWKIDLLPFVRRIINS